MGPNRTDARVCGTSVRLQSCASQVTPEVGAHLKEADVATKDYDATLGDVRSMAADSLALWADPTKVSPCHWSASAVSLDI